MLRLKSQKTQAGVVVEPIPLSGEERWGGENPIGMSCNSEYQHAPESLGPLSCIPAAPVCFCLRAFSGHRSSLGFLKGKLVLPGAHLSMTDGQIPQFPLPSAGSSETWSIQSHRGFSMGLSPSFPVLT